MIEIVIVDDDSVARSGIRAMLKPSDDIEIVAETGTARECVVAVKSLMPQVVLLDLKLPGQNGLELAEFLVEKAPEARILVVTGRQEEYGVQRLIETGALGYVTKNLERTELVTAIRTVASGKPYMSEEARATFLEELTLPRYSGLLAS